MGRKLEGAMDRRRNEEVRDAKWCYQVVFKDRRSQILKYIKSTIERHQEARVALDGAFKRAIELYKEKKRNPYLMRRDGNHYLWGAKEILNVLGCCGDYDFDENRSEHFLRISKDRASNLLIDGYRWRKIFLPRLEAMVSREERGGYESSAFRALVTLRAFETRSRLDQIEQFTSDGERYIIAESALSSEQPKVDNKVDNAVFAVPFRHARTLSEIDSIRLHEKVCQTIKKKKLSHIECKEIKIAAFGSFCDKPSPNGKHNIERAFDGGKNDKVKVSITYFELKNITPVSIIFEEKTRGESIEGNLYDPDFLVGVSKKYDIICLLDMGCLYGDTNRKTERYERFPEDDLQGSINTFNYEEGRNGISAEAYYNLYKSLIRWIEDAFYGKHHQYEFDARLYCTLKNVSLNAANSSSIYMFISHDRGRALREMLEDSNLCRYEYYNGRAITVYDWSNNIEEINAERGEECEYLTNLLSNAVPDTKTLKVRAWKIVKSLDDFYYSEEFTEIITGRWTGNSTSKRTGVRADIDFVNFLKKTYVVIDYSGMNTSNARSVIHYSVVIKEGELNEYEKSYMSAVKQLIQAMFELAYDCKCYEDCSSNFCRTIINNALMADATRAEHLLLLDMISTRYLYQNALSFEYSETIDVSDGCENIDTENPKQHSVRQKTNTALNNIIYEINRDTSIKSSNPWSFDIASDIVNQQFLKNGALAMSVENFPDKILERLGKACKALDYNDSKILMCTR